LEAFLKNKWHILFCDSHTRICPIYDFLETCRKEHQIKLLHFMRLLEEMGPLLPRPYADLLDDGIHELRVKLSGEQFRFLYFFCFEEYIIFYEYLVKHTGPVPPGAIHKMKEYRDSLLKRMAKSDLEMAAV
jgi:phage-related protein